MNHPPAEIELGPDTVRRLLTASCPELARLPIHHCDEGWDNFTFRVGPEHAVRLPRRQAAAALLENEQRWLPRIAGRLPVAVPAPVHCGKPCETFPWPWSVVKWIPGETAEAHGFTSADIRLLAEALRALHQPALDAVPFNASFAVPVNPYRGVPLATCNDLVSERLRRLSRHPSVAGLPLAALWRAACDAPIAQRRVWLHGDLHPRNVVIRDGALVGVIDWGDLCGGDPATDLASAWLLIDSAAGRREFLTCYGGTPCLHRRATGWAIHLGLALVDSNEPRHQPLGQTALARVIEDSLGAEHG